MISVGIDVSKGKSTVCILKSDGEILKRAFEVQHTTHELGKLSKMILQFDEEVKVVMEATGIYHLPLLTYLQNQGIFVSVINPYQMKKYRMQGLRRVKTDKQDALSISNYGLDFWSRLENFEGKGEHYQELKLLSQQYAHYMTLKVRALQDLTHLLDYTMPGIKGLLQGYSASNGKDKLADFVEAFWHFQKITSLTEEDFTEKYLLWARKKGYRASRQKAKTIFALALEGIPTLPSEYASLELLMRRAVETLRFLNETLALILSQMRALAQSLPEYSTVRAMTGIGDVLAPLLVAEIGDVRRFHSAKALIAYAGIDAPPFQSGQFIGTRRNISKRGSASLRRVGYQVVRCLMTHSYPEDPVYNYIRKKEAEGKAKKVAKIAGLNKFLRIYFARVSEVYQA